ncbi:MAG: bifunctional precorrin-2 dehydrogenase/sirohydrochlorin ferrochelatase [Candidatus Binatia bacterium]|nr:bifunctional precorrin-2 dehydrogenase/sirohydrochlorin ferrochelatase [Candidatus Binatia bacterium]
MKYYPLFLDLRGRPCLVIGGGAVAERKVAALLQAGGQVTVVSPTLTPQLHRWREAGAIVVHQRSYRPGDLQDFVLIFAATDDAELHRRIAHEAATRGALLNVVDQPALCSFIVPAVVSRGDLTIAVSTAGTSPALAGKIRRVLEQQFGPEYEWTLRLLARVREWMQTHGMPAAARRRLLTTLAESPLVEYVRERQVEEIDTLLQRTVAESCTLKGLGLSL